MDAGDSAAGDEPVVGQRGADEFRDDGEVRAGGKRRGRDLGGWKEDRRAERWRFRGRQMAWLWSRWVRDAGAGRVAGGVGYNAYLIQQSGAPWAQTRREPAEDRRHLRHLRDEEPPHRSAGGIGGRRRHRDAFAGRKRVAGSRDYPLRDAGRSTRAIRNLRMRAKGAMCRSRTRACSRRIGTTRTRGGCRSI